MALGPVDEASADHADHAIDELRREKGPVALLFTPRLDGRWKAVMLSALYQRISLH